MLARVCLIFSIERVLSELKMRNRHKNWFLRRFYLGYKAVVQTGSRTQIRYRTIDPTKARLRAKVFEV